MKKGNKKGITLIALVITIIILLILAGITILTLTGNNGLFSRAKQAKEETEYSYAKEEIATKIMETIVKCESNQKEYNIKELAKTFEESENITTQKYYTANLSIKKEGLEEIPIDIKGVVIAVNKYPKYKFLIGETCEIEYVTVIKDIDLVEQSDFIEISKFEQDMFGKNIINKEETVVPPKEVETQVPSVDENTNVNASINLETYMSVKNNTNNNLKLAKVENIEYQIETKTDNINLLNTTLSINNKATSEDSCKIKITGTYNGQTYINNLTVYVEPKANDKIIDKDGNEQEAYSIYTAQDLKRLGELINNKIGNTQNAVLKKSIDLSNIYGENIADWIPIGTENNQYKGYFDGKTFTIKNIYINNKNSNNQGLFGYASNGKISNIKINGNINGNTNIGGICAICKDEIIENCVNYVNITSESQQVGGILGNINSATDNKILKCQNYGNISGRQNVGGIVGGKNIGNLQISESANYGDVLASSLQAGGMIAGTFGNQTNISNCYNKGKITSSDRVGGIIGTAYSWFGAEKIEISNCYNAGEISPSGSYGGIMGLNQANSSIFSNCYFINSCDKWITTGIQSVDTSSLIMHSDILGNLYKNDTSNINEGYPIFVWQ